MDKAKRHSSISSTKSANTKHRPGSEHSCTAEQCWASENGHYPVLLFWSLCTLLLQSDNQLALSKLPIYPHKSKKLLWILQLACFENADHRFRFRVKIQKYFRKKILKKKSISTTIIQNPNNQSLWKRRGPCKNRFNWTECRTMYKVWILILRSVIKCTAGKRKRRSNISYTT